MKDQWASLLLFSCRQVCVSSNVLFDDLCCSSQLISHLVNKGKKYVSKVNITSK